MAKKKITQISINQAAIQQTKLDAKQLAAYKEALAGTDIPKEEHTLLAQLLAYYDIPAEDTQNFFFPEQDKSLPEPFALKDMRKGVDLVLNSITKKKKIAVWADYDVDGNTSAALLGHTLEALGAEDPILTIPTREEGFGLNIPGIRKLAKEGVETLIVADSGTVAHEQIAEAKKLGMEVLVLDHHRPHEGEELPDALVINPNREDDSSPHTAMAAASVSYTFVRDMVEALKAKGHTKKAAAVDFGQLCAVAAIGVVADVVSLKDSANRYIVREGLKELNSGKYPGINALQDLYSDTLGNRDITAEDIAFTIGPGINAASRLGEPDLGMQLLLAKTEDEALPIAKRIKAANEERKIITEQVFEEADAQVQAFLAENPKANFLMVESEKWHAGVVGIVAGRLKEKYNLPTAVGHVFKNKGKGSNITYSIRSEGGVDFFSEAITPLLEKKVKGVKKIGGHAMAAGATIEAKEKDNIRTFIDKALKEPVAQSQESRRLEYLGELSPEQLSSGAFQRSYERMEPFGQHLKRPYYLMKDVQVKGIKQVGHNKEHLQFSIGEATAGNEDNQNAVRGGVLFRAMGTDMGNVLTSATRRDEKMDMVVDPFIREYKGQQQVGFLPVDIANVERLNALPSQDELETHSEALLKHRRDEMKAEAESVQKLPR
ncbi:MAG: single-stranded-DNA-specific exonuclease RecJ, partial [Rickettsiales bacterium]